MVIYCNLFFPEYLFSVNYLTFLVPRAVFIRSYATKSYSINKNVQKALEGMTGGAYHEKHFATTDVAKINANGEVPFYHQGTHVLVLKIIQVKNSILQKIIVVCRIRSTKCCLSRS